MPILAVPIFGEVGDLLFEYLPVFVTALLISLAATPVFAKVAKTLGIVDRPSGRKIHQRAVPYLGGLAILLGWLVAVVVGAKLHLLGPGMRVPITGIVVGVLIATLTGLLDDLIDLPPVLKVAGQMAAAFALLATGVGSGIIEASIPLSALGLDLGPVAVRYASIVFSLFIVLAMCNAANLLDGLDGLCSGVNVIMVSTMMVISLYLTLGGMDIVYDPTRMIVSLALLGAVIGFIPYNYNPASIFMGDAGSMMIGFSAAALLLLLGDRVPTSRYFWAAAVVFGLPAFDTLLAMVRRILAGRSPFIADANHLHHQLIRQGLTVRQAVSILYLIASIFAILGFLMLQIRLRYSVLILGAIGLNLLLLTVSFRLHRMDPPTQVSEATAAGLPRESDADLVSTPMTGGDAPLDEPGVGQERGQGDPPE